ncbi:MAG TPA: phosphoribosylglycinamide formyltransferase [Flavisolibacter sp.]|jgi:formyltetrahydrofolate-dependent phosphoribosylglycinamide formyltransferase
MLQRLQQKWKVGPVQLVLILCVFAITGTTTAYISKAITSWVGFTDATHWGPKLLVRLAVLIFGYQIILLCVAFLFGQFSFFWRYERKLLVRMRVLRERTTDDRQPITDDRQPMTDERVEGYSREAKASGGPTSNLKPQTSNPAIAVFASGAGSNARKIIEHFKDSATAKVALVVCNKPGAGVIDIAAEHGIPVLMIEKERFFRGDAYLPELEQKGIRWVVLAGFLWKVPLALVTAYRNHIINIHPALLPGYGGKGMYGNFVHEAVISAGETRSGITIHYVDEHYDNGDIIFQAHCPVLPTDTPSALAQRIHSLEHEHFPRIIEQEIRRGLKAEGGKAVSR